MSESTIRADSPVVTLINVFTVEPENQGRLIEAWQSSTDEVIRHLPGFVSANIHASLDGTKVVNYAQWESQESFTSMLADRRPANGSASSPRSAPPHPRSAESSPCTTQLSDRPG